MHDWDNKENATVRRVVKLDLYNNKDTVEGTKKDDITILTLNKPVKFSLDIVPICLPTSGKIYSYNLYKYFCFKIILLGKKYNHKNACTD